MNWALLLLVLLGIIAAHSPNQATACVVAFLLGLAYAIAVMRPSTVDGETEGEER